MKAPPKPLVYLLGGGSTVPMRLNVPNTLTDTGIVGVACGRSQRAGVTEDGKLIFWEVSDSLHCVCLHLLCYTYTYTGMYTPVHVVHIFGILSSDTPLIQEILVGIQLVLCFSWSMSCNL